MLRRVRVKPSAQAAPRAARAASGPRRSVAGITLVELSLLIAIIGIVLAVAIPTFMKTVRVSRISEASEQLERMFVGIAAYHGSLQTLDAGRAMGCLPPPAGPTPAVPSPTGVEVDFFDEELPESAVWKALGFNPAGAVRYAYTFEPVQQGCEVPDPLPPVIVRWRAQGDLDGDGDLSTFERAASLLDGRLQPQPLLQVDRRTE